MIQADPRRLLPPCLSFIDFRSSVQPSTYFLQTLLNRLSRIISSTLRLKIVLVCRTTEGSVSHSPSRIAKYTHYFFVSLFQHLCVQSGGNKVSLARSPVNNGESTIDYCINRLVETYIITRLIESFSKNLCLHLRWKVSTKTCCWEKTENALSKVNVREPTLPPAQRKTHQNSSLFSVYTLKSFQFLRVHLPKHNRKAQRGEQTHSPNQIQSNLIADLAWVISQIITNIYRVLLGE